MEKFIDKIESLTPEERRIICNKATEHPHSGAYNTTTESGTYLCRRCGLALFRADSQFSSGCGWPSFDITIPNSVLEKPDIDGIRTEILCQRCKAHLGHVFEGEFFTAKNRRFCVNSASIDFVLHPKVKDTEEAIVAGGCFWGVEYFLSRLPGVLKAESGYTGGILDHPNYRIVCEGNSGHYEAVRVLYDPQEIDYTSLLGFFFEIHDPTQSNGQGPDIGSQYQSAIFYYNSAQKDEAALLIQELKANGFNTATQLFPVQIFWPAEEYHQHYYQKNEKQPYCHRRVKRFG